jgi:hypothetical protein
MVNFNIGGLEIMCTLLHSSAKVWSSLGMQCSPHAEINPNLDLQHALLSGHAYVSLVAMVLMNDLIGLVRLASHYVRKTWLLWGAGAVMLFSGTNERSPFWSRIHVFLGGDTQHMNQLGGSQYQVSARTGPFKN